MAKNTGRTTKTGKIVPSLSYKDIERDFPYLRYQGGTSRKYLDTRTGKLIPNRTAQSMYIESHPEIYGEAKTLREIQPPDINITRTRVGRFNIQTSYYGGETWEQLISILKRLHKKFPNDGYYIMAYGHAVSNYIGTDGKEVIVKKGELHWAPLTHGAMQATKFPLLKQKLLEELNEIFPERLTDVIHYAILRQTGVE